MALKRRPNTRLQVEIRLLEARSGTVPAVAEPTDEGLKERLSRQGEEALGKLAEELVANPVVNAALARAFEAREKAVQAQEAAMGALGIPSAADIERLTRRLRSVSQRLEGDRGRGRPARRADRLGRRRAPAEPSSRSWPTGSTRASTSSRATSRPSARPSRPATSCRRGRRSA